jgi:hypothetical protein
MSRPIPPTYKTRNWPAYNEALKRRGSLTIWFDPEMSWDAAPTGRRGRQQTYSDAAIQTCLSMKVLFGMALRQTTGFVESLLRLVGLNVCDGYAPLIFDLRRAFAQVAQVFTSSSGSPERAHSEVVFCWE